jgi:hypothetical protein
MQSVLREPVELIDVEIDSVAGGVSQVSIGNSAAQAVVGNVFAQSAVGWWSAENAITIANNAGNINNAFNG